MFVIFIHIVFAFDSNIGIVRIFQNEVYRTFAVPICDRIPPDNALLTATSLFDVKAFHTALVPRRADHVCPRVESFDRRGT